MRGANHDPLLISFLHHFNHTRDYYACHDEMEELWLEEGRKPLYQGLLQVAVSLYHLGNGNRGGAIKLMSAALEKLSGYDSPQLGLDLALLLADCQEQLSIMKTLSGPPVGHLMEIRIIDPDLQAAVSRI